MDDTLPIFPFPFSLLLQHFWLLLGLGWFVGTRLGVPHRLRHGMEQARTKTLYRRFGLLVLLVSTLLWLIQMSAGPAPTPFISPWPELQKWLGFGTAFLVWVATGLWVFVAGGARTLAQASGNTEGQVRLYVVLVLSSSVLGGILMLAFGDDFLAAFARELAESRQQSVADPPE